MLNTKKSKIIKKNMAKKKTLYMVFIDTINKKKRYMGL